MPIRGADRSKYKFQFLYILLLYNKIQSTFVIDALFGTQSKYKIVSDHATNTWSLAVNPQFENKIY